MTIKEITILRKSGHLAEAMTAAEIEFAHNANKYTANALFWCLNDLLKQQSGDDVAFSVERMKRLYDDFCPDNEFMQRTIASVEKRVLLHYYELKTAVENAKNGADAISVHKEVSMWYSNGELDTRLYQDFGWLTYYALKQTNLNEVQKRKILLNLYLKLDLPTPSILHSLILGEAVKVEKTTPLQFRLRDFVRLWGLENLRNEDWEQFHTDEGNTKLSLVEKLIGVYAKELRTDHVEASDDFSRLVDKALVVFPNNQYLPQYKASVLISQKKADEALTYYKDMILNSPSKFYLWDQAADLVQDIDTKIGLICRALSCGVEDKFIGKVQLRLASLLVQKSMLSNAKYELEKFRQTYQKNGWNLKPEFWNLYNRLTSVETAANNDAIYIKYSIKADEFIYSSFPTILAVKVGESQNDDRIHPGRKITTWIFRTEKSTVRLRKPTKYGLNRRISNGAAFDIKVRDGKIVWIKEHRGIIYDSWIKEHCGKVNLRTDRKGKKYAIISGSYVSEDLLTGFNDGQEIRIRSIQHKDGRWSALSILKY